MQVPPIMASSRSTSTTRLPWDARSRARVWKETAEALLAAMAVSSASTTAGEFRIPPSLNRSVRMNLIQIPTQEQGRVLGRGLTPRRKTRAQKPTENLLEGQRFRFPAGRSPSKSPDKETAPNPGSCSHQERVRIR